MAEVILGDATYEGISRLAEGGFTCDLATRGFRYSNGTTYDSGTLCWSSDGSAPLPEGYIIVSDLAKIQDRPAALRAALGAIAGL